IVRAAGAGAVRAAGLRHEALDDAVEYDPVVEALAHQRLDALDMLRREIGTQLDHDVALGGLQGQLVLVVCHGFSVFLLRRRSRIAMRKDLPATAPPIDSVKGMCAQRSIASATAWK